MPSTLVTAALDVAREDLGGRTQRETIEFVFHHGEVARSSKSCGKVCYVDPCGEDIDLSRPSSCIYGRKRTILQSAEAKTD